MLAAVCILLFWSQAAQYGLRFKILHRPCSDACAYHSSASFLEYQIESTHSQRTHAMTSTHNLG